MPLPNPQDMYNQMMQGAPQQQSQPWAGGHNSYLENQSAGNLAGQGRWEDFVRQLGITNLANITDFNSPLYQQYSQFLNKNTPQIGVNSLLAPLLAGGASYGGSQAIAGKRAQAMAGQRQDAMNTNVQGFAMGMQNQVLPQLGQIGGSFAQSRQMDMQQQQINSANSPWGAIGGLLGAGIGTLIAPGIGTQIGGQMGGMAGGMAGGGMSPSQNQYWGNSSRPSPSPYGG